MTGGSINTIMLLGFSFLPFYLFYIYIYDKAPQAEHSHTRLIN